MSQGEFAIEVTGLSPKATEKDLFEFFSFCGSIDHLEIFRYSLSFQRASNCVFVSTNWFSSFQVYMQSKIIV